MDNRFAQESELFERVLEAGGVESSIHPIFTWWTATFLAPQLRAVFGTDDIAHLFAKEIAAVGRPHMRIVSLGAGDCQTEIRVAKYLLAMNVDINFIAIELSPKIVAHANGLALESGLDPAQFRAVSMNLSNDFPDGPFDAVMVNHALHHFEDLEFLFSNVLGGLTSDGHFVISDMIGRNGHQRWPEALPIVEALWDSLPLAKRHNFQAGCIEERFSNFDCRQSDPFEGVRSQDILPLLLQAFNFRRFVGFGGLPDIFVDRAYGGNFDPGSESDRAFITLCNTLNDRLIDGGYLKPTMMFATCVRDPAPEPVYGRWSPECSLRTPD